jgi:putative glycosyltransferase (TIGR04372 family)
MAIKKLISGYKKIKYKIRKKGFINLLKNQIVINSHKLIIAMLVLIEIPFFLIIALIGPYILIRFGMLQSSRIGHFAANTELYICEKSSGINVPIDRRKVIDIFYFDRKICNNYLALLWKSKLLVYPSVLIKPLEILTRLIPILKHHRVPPLLNSDRDIGNLLDNCPQLKIFSKKENDRGKIMLEKNNIDPDSKIICINVRDDAYLNSYIPNNWGYHSYRDNNIQNVVKAANAMADMGYYVFRMGSKVKEEIESDHPRVIDYATNGMRSEFLDIYLASVCEFFASTGTGWEEVPGWMFRKPGLFFNLVPIGYLPTYSSKWVLTTKRHIDLKTNCELSLSEIIDSKVAFAQSTYQFNNNSIYLKENTEDEILDSVIELEKRVSGNWIDDKHGIALQAKFWSKFPVNALDPVFGKPLHGKIKAKFSTKYLKNNSWWLN